MGVRRQPERASPRQRDRDESVGREPHGQDQLLRRQVAAPGRFRFRGSDHPDRLGLHLQGGSLVRRGRSPVNRSDVHGISSLRPRRCRPGLSPHRRQLHAEPGADQPAGREQLSVRDAEREPERHEREPVHFLNRAVRLSAGDHPRVHGILGHLREDLGHARRPRRRQRRRKRLPGESRRGLGQLELHRVEPDQRPGTN